jgi:CheY-like chemotaxis protein
MRSVAYLSQPAYGVHDGAHMLECGADLASMFGYATPDRMIGLSPLDLIDPSCQEAFGRQTLGGTSDGPYETLGVTAGGTKFRLEVSSRAIRFRGEVARLLLLRSLAPVAMVVDDEDVVRNLVCSLLERLGFQALTAESGEAAVSMVAADQFALLVTDIVMTGMSGTELAAQVRALDATVPILLMSGTALESSLQADPYSAFLGKPFGAAELESVIRGLPPRASEGLIK